MTVPQQTLKFRFHRGNSSVGRARPCQGRGREFESRFPLQIHVDPGSPGFVLSKEVTGLVAEWSCSGLQSRVRRFDSDPGLHISKEPASAGFLLPAQRAYSDVLSRAWFSMRLRSGTLCARPGGEMVDAGDLKSPDASRAGSSPAPGTYSTHVRGRFGPGPLRAAARSSLRRLKGHRGAVRVPPRAPSVRSRAHRLARTARILPGVPCRAIPPTSSRCC